MKRDSAIRHAGLGLLIIAGALLLLVHFTKSLPDAYAIGCDSYGYLKQKQLLTTQGLQKGLHTAATDGEAGFLISIASKINANTLNWSEMIAPHCHHYDKATAQIVLQYPPGTGFVLSLLPEGRELQTLSVLMVLSTVLLYCLGNILVFRFEYFLFSTFICFVMLATMAKYQVASYSIPVTLTLIPWIAILSRMIRPWLSVRDVLLATILGILCGLLVDVRIASLLILPGVAGIYAVKALYSQHQRQWKDWLVPAIFLSFFGLTLIPLLVANTLNAGGAFNPTYAVYDRELRFNNPELIINNVHYYLTDNLTGILAVLALAFFALRLSRDNLRLERPERANLYVLLLLFLGNLTFYSLKPVSIEYYFLPVAVFCLCFGLLDFPVGRTDSTRSNGLRPALLVGLTSILTLGAMAAQRVSIEVPRKVEIRAPEFILDKQNIVYAGITGGTINYYLGKYTAKLDFGTYCMVEQLLNRVARTGRSQYIVNDTPKMNQLIDDIGTEKFDKVGSFEDLASRYDIYRYNARFADAPEISCDLTVNRQWVSQIDLKVSGRVSGDAFRGTVSLTNNSDTSFSTRPVAGPVKLSWRFVSTSDSGTPPPWEARKNLTMMIESKHTYEIPFTAQLPAKKGEYLLEVTLVQEGFAWFNEHGMATPTLRVVVE